VVDIIYCDELDAFTHPVINVPEDFSEQYALGQGNGSGEHAADPTTVTKGQNFISGRIGEEMALNYLRQYVAKKGLKSVPCTKVHWLNEQTESGLPYDIELTFADGSVKHCEVKTRSVARQSALPTPARHLPSQWLVSPAEVARADLERQGYFCVFVSLCIDYSARQVEELQTRIVGYESGLTSAVYQDQATLYIQINC
jgi:hypothetical protein